MLSLRWPAFRGAFWQMASHQAVLPCPEERRVNPLESFHPQPLPSRHRINLMNTDFPVVDLLSFHTLTTIKFHNPFRFTLIQIAPGVYPPSVAPSAKFKLAPSFSYPLTSLAATLTELPASVATKRLTPLLSPVDATLTKNRGEGARDHESRIVLPHRAPRPKLKEMIPKSIQVRHWRKAALQNVEPDPIKIVPFGRYGGGEWNAHPIGLVVVLGFLLMGLVGIPEFKWFFAGALALGSLCGLLLWRYHR
jgi:hypothetical protein